MIAGNAITAGSITATRRPQKAAAMPEMTSAKETPKHHVARLMLTTRPRKRAGQVSATSRDPNDHSPFSAKFTTDRRCTRDGQRTFQSA
jgi:hypothetical protein